MLRKMRLLPQPRSLARGLLLLGGAVGAAQALPLTRGAGFATATPSPSASPRHGHGHGHKHTYEPQEHLYTPPPEHLSLKVGWLGSGWVE